MFQAHKSDKLFFSVFFLISIHSKSNGVPKMAKLISGVAIAKEIRQELKEHIIEWEAAGHRAPHLTAVLIGDDPASHTYVNNKIKVGIAQSICPQCVEWNFSTE